MFTTLHDHKSLHIQEEPDRRGHDCNLSMLPSARKSIMSLSTLPIELFDEILDQLSFSDYKALRLTVPTFNESLVARLFEDYYINFDINCLANLSQASRIPSIVKSIRTLHLDTKILREGITQEEYEQQLDLRPKYSTWDAERIKPADDTDYVRIQREYEALDRKGGLSPAQVTTGYEAHCAYRASQLAWGAKQDRELQRAIARLPKLRRVTACNFILQGGRMPEGSVVWRRVLKSTFLRPGRESLFTPSEQDRVDTRGRPVAALVRALEYRATLAANEPLRELELEIPYTEPPRTRGFVPRCTDDPWDLFPELVPPLSLAPLAEPVHVDTSSLSPVFDADVRVAKSLHEGDFDGFQAFAALEKLSINCNWIGSQTYIERERVGGSELSGATSTLVSSIGRLLKATQQLRELTLKFDLEYDTSDSDCDFLMYLESPPLPCLQTLHFSAPFTGPRLLDWLATTSVKSLNLVDCELVNVGSCRTWREVFNRLHRVVSLDSYYFETLTDYEALQVNSFRYMGVDEETDDVDMGYGTSAYYFDDGMSIETKGGYAASIREAIVNGVPLESMRQ